MSPSSPSPLLQFLKSSSPLRGDPPNVTFFHRYLLSVPPRSGSGALPRLVLVCLAGWSVSSLEASLPAPPAPLPRLPQSSGRGAGRGAGAGTGPTGRRGRGAQSVGTRPRRREGAAPSLAMVPAVPGDLTQRPLLARHRHGPAGFWGRGLRASPPGFERHPHIPAGLSLDLFSWEQNSGWGVL